MLIKSPRHTHADLTAWERLTRYDHTLAKTIQWGPKIDAAHDTIRAFAAAGGCYASTSWGKDSTVIAHLCATSGVRLPLVYVRLEDYDNPDSLLVRDAFLARWGDQVEYDEIAVPSTNVARWWHEDTTGMVKHAPDPGFKEAGRRYGDRYISGIRGEESRIRRMVMGRWGEAGPHSCRPIGRWKATDVFAYLTKFDLPIHPAYAMSHGGRLDRRWIRVSTIGGVRGADKGRADWETAYYPDIVPQNHP
ncbi:phosphoadenosine phosphosulfate reductase family protein [Corynebacterium vitaeruminis]|uniref:phosphoadenosine phosphosulfate reductase domain-containing protein n=1 Tax=Corynebacterium vitaeruminis TaxID=38305 RepID=UPI0023F592FA|nr:phosphoadenosine phosphosulfate reductase family protein [Corynebacterium vitaeruminis]